MKPGSTAFSVNSSGHILALRSDSEFKWKPLPFLGINFKRISAAGNSLWALGGDHQIYVCVFGVEIPIRVKEETYENQRWTPVNGFSEKLLPTDRPNYSTIDGMHEKCKDKIKLPTMAWQWESPWYVDTRLNGKQLEQDGWTYAVDFPAEYSSSKKFTSCVRRRKWIRYRKYIALDTWSAVPGIGQGETEEPFIDLAVGGHELPNGDPDESFVWAVSVLGKVYIRQRVTSNSPEGSGWLHITTPDKCEVSQISVGPTGLVWAVTWHGKALVRHGITRLDPSGTSWSVLDPPGPSLNMIAVGNHCVWAIGRDKSVWFRNGIHGAGSGESEALARGTKWVGMVGSLCMISVGPLDQVLAIQDDHERSIVIRTGVSSSDLSGKTWKVISAGITEDSVDTLKPNLQVLRTRPSVERDPEPPKQADDAKSNIAEGSSNASFKKAADEIGERTAKEMAARIATGVVGATVGRIPVAGPIVASVAGQVVREELSKVKIVDEIKKNVAKEEDSEESKTIDQSMYQSALEEPEADRLSMTSDQALFDREDIYGDVALNDNIRDSGPQWTWLTLGTCKLDPSQLPGAWFVEHFPSSSSSMSNETWRLNILENLKANNATASSFKDYDTAIERASWVRKGHGRVLFAANTSGNKWENCTLELEQTGTQGGEVEFGTLSIFGSKDKNKEHLSLSEITCVCRYSGADKTMAIHTPARSFLLMPLLIKFNADQELEEWQADITAGINSVMKTQCKASTGSLISVTSQGEVCLFDSSAMERSGIDSSVRRSQADNVFSQCINVSSSPLPLVQMLENGFNEDSSIFLQVKLAETPDARFALNLHTGRAVVEADIALHFNPRLDQNKVALNDKKDGVWGNEDAQPLIIMQEDSAVKVFNPGHSVQLLIESEAAHLKISVNGCLFAKFKHRMRPEDITHLRLYGDIEPQKLEYRSKTVIIPPKEMYWRILGGGHMLKVESTSVNHQLIMWGLTYDSKPWIYTNGWGGAHFKGIDSSKSDLLNPIEDSRYYYVYENQRWNPLTGFTSHGLPTDRYNWSDRSGKLALCKESIKLPSVHWQWTSDWLIDFSTPGGADHDGWQYATDFPASYHPSKKFTDYVRRRRWTRKCKLVSSGPWKPLGSTKLIDVSMKPHLTKDLVYTWAVTAKGEVLFRLAVTSKCPEGTDWMHVTSDVAFQSVTISGRGTETCPLKVWVVAKDGSMFLRHGITEVAPTGQFWLQVQPPVTSGELKSVSGGDNALWALDHGGKLWYRQDISPVFPEGTSWTNVPCVPSTPNAFTGSLEVRDISASCDELWAILDNVSLSPLGSSPAANALVSAMGASAHTLGSVASAAINAAGYAQGGPVHGVIVRRSGITPGCHLGTGWEIVVGGGWKDVCIRGRLSKHFKTHF